MTRAIYDQKFLTIFNHTALFQTLLLMGVIGSAQAAEDLTPGAKNIEEVVVTASKREQLLKDFSGSVSIIKTDELNPHKTLGDIANQVPGFNVVDNGPRVPASLIIRGLRMDELSSSDFGGDGSAVASYVDNIPLQGFFVPPAFSLKDLQQVEVLRGPQGTLYGNASIGGLIRYVTAKPDLSKNTAEMNVVVSQTAESNTLNYDTDLVINAPLIDNTLGARLLISKEYNAGFIDNHYLIAGPKNDINADTARQIRATILWKPSDEFSLTGSYDYQKIHADDRQAVNESFTDDKYGASSHYQQPMQGELRLASLDATYEFSNTKLTASLNRYEYKSQTMADQTDYLLTNYGDYYGVYEDFSAFTRGDIAVTKNSGELRLVSSNEQPLRWLLGAFVSSDDLDATIADRVPGFGSAVDEDRPNDLDYLGVQAETLHEQAVYGEVAYDIQPEWEVAVGARHVRYKDDADSCGLVFPTSEPYSGNHYPLDCLSGNNTETGSLGKFSTHYKFNEKQNIYFTVADGYRRGGTNFLPVDTIHQRSYKPDTAVNYELGTHSDFLNGTLQFNGAIFYMDWRNVQVTSTVEEQNNGYSIVTNAGKARSQGVELETISQLNPYWNLRFAYTYTQAELTETIMNINGGEENAYAGNRLPGSPHQQWNIGLNYKGTINSAIVTASIHYSYASDITTYLNKEFADFARLDGYSIVNAQTAVSLCNWRLGIFINNIANTRAITGKRTAALYGEQGQFDYITRPRTVGLSARYQF